MLKNFHPVFQFIIIAMLLVAFVCTVLHFHIGFGAAMLVLIEAAALGASVTTHEENSLKYNLEDLEEDELAKIERYATDEGKAALAKLRKIAATAEFWKRKAV